ncbi:MAG: phosphatase PAP2 family protein [Clostridia bacterium]|nr:phosphatase PAP2 family protein [Clostridia bacterium]
MKESNVLKRIPWWGWLLGAGLFAFQFALYRAAYSLTEMLGTIDHAWCPKIPAIDDKIPVIPVFIIIYIFSYLYWICAPAVVTLTKRSNLINFVIGMIVSFLIGFIIFSLFPSYMDRAAEGIMDFSSEDGIMYGLMAWIYSMDGSTIALNLCPSFHCMITTYCYLGVRRQEEIHTGYKAFALAMAILVCLSTQFVKQHYIIDMIAGVGLAVICYLIIEKINPGKS